MCHGIGHANETNLRETLRLVLSAACEYKQRSITSASSQLNSGSIFVLDTGRLTGDGALRE
jgi:hypothetical protein